jgi:hypothetical protein
LVVLCGIGGIAFNTHRAAATITNFISFQGKLTNTDGTNVTDGNYSIRFRIYNDPSADAANTCSANSCKWEETQATVAVSAGLFQVNLGTGTTLPGSVDFNTNALYLGVKIGSDAEMTPRVRLTAAPQAFNSDMLDGLDSSNFVQLSGGNVNIGAGTVTSGAINGVAIGSTIQPSAAGALTVKSNGANALGLDTGGGAAINIGGTNATSVVVGNATSNPNISFSGSGTFGTNAGSVSLNGNTTVTGTKTLTVSGGLTTLGAGLTFSGAAAQTITGPGTGGLTVTVASGPLSLSTTTLGTLSVTSAGALSLTGGAASSWDIGANTLSLQTTNNGAITTGTGTLTQGGNVTFSGTTARTLTGPGTGGLTVTVASGPLSLSTTTSGTLSLTSAGALNMTGAAASTWDIGNNTLSLQTTNNGAITTGTGLLTQGGNLTFSGTTARTITGPATGGLTINVTGGPLTLSTTTSGILTIQGSSGGVVITSGANITLGAVDGTATQLVLDSRNISGETSAPAVTGVNGGEYYNSANNKFRCFENSVWKNCTSGTGDTFSTVGGPATTAATKAAAGTILIAPLYISGQTTVNELRVSVITTVLGAAGDVGIYNAAGTLVLNAGSSSVTTAVGLKTLAPVQTGVARILEPGQYYAAVTWNATTGSVSSAALPVAGMIKRVGTIVGGGLVLPASLTLSSITAAVNMPAITINN